MGCAIAATAAQGYPDRITALVLILSAGIGLEGIAGTFFSYLQYQGRQSAEGKIRITASIAAFGYGFASLYLKVSCVMLSLFTVIWAAANTVMSALANRSLFRADRQLHPVSEAGKLFRTCWVFLLISTAAMLYNKVNVFFLHRLGGSETMAQYSATWSIIEGIAALVSNLMLGAVLFPVFARLHSEDKEQLSLLARNAFNWLLLVALPLTFVVIVESDRIIGIVYGDGYSDAATLQKVLAIAIPIGFLHNLAAYLMLSSGRERPLLAIYSTGLLLSVVLCAILIPAAPLAGATTSILAAKAVVAAGTVGFCQRRFGLIKMAPLAETILGLAAMIGIYLLLKTRVPREIAELLAVMPPLAVAWRWWKTRNRHGIPQP
jgi:O-antigen/teichoic acid export membrane protein